MISSNNSYENVKITDESFEKASFEIVEFSKCDISESRFYECSFTGCFWEDCKFDSCDFSLSKLPNSSFSSCTFRNCRLIGIDWSLLVSDVGLELICDRCDLRYSTFERLNLNRSSFTDCQLDEVTFMNSKMKEVKFRDSSFKATRFVDCDCSDADFTGAKDLFFDIRVNEVKGMKVDTTVALNLIEIVGITVE